jgi:hypothetical protein
MRKIRPARASAELGPGTAATPHTLPSAIVSARPRPAARTPSFARIFCFARASSTHHESPGQHMRARASAHFRPRRRDWSTPRRVHLAHAGTRELPAPLVLPPLSSAMRFTSASSQQVLSFLSNFRSSTPAIANDVRRADASRSVPPARPKPAASATAPAQQYLAAASRAPSRAYHLRHAVPHFRNRS